jgi:hypothetical protein
VCASDYTVTGSGPVFVSLRDPFVSHVGIEILASRIAAQALEGEILIAEPVRHLLAGKGFAERSCRRGLRTPCGCLKSAGGSDDGERAR